MHLSPLYTINYEYVTAREKAFVVRFACKFIGNTGTYAGAESVANSHQAEHGSELNDYEIISYFDHVGLLVKYTTTGRYIAQYGAHIVSFDSLDDATKEFCDMKNHHHTCYPEFKADTWKRKAFIEKALDRRKKIFIKAYEEISAQEINMDASRSADEIFALVVEKAARQTTFGKDRGLSDEN